MIVIRQLRKSFGPVTALDGLDLTVSAGEIYSLLGPNGAGKTTTINTLLGFVTADHGEVVVDGINLAEAPQQARQRIAYIPEQVQLYPRLTGLENLRYFHGLSRGARRSSAELVRCLCDAGLQEDAVFRPVAEYSKGMRQKVGIAIALARRAPVMLLDEPTSGLDPQASWEFGNSLRWLSEQGVAVLMATHDLFRAREVAGRIGIIVDGRMVEELNGDQVDAATLEARYLERVAPPREVPA